MRTWPIACVPGELVEAVLLGDGLGVAEVLDDLERAAEREHLGVGDVLDEVGEQLQVAVVLERDAEGVLGLLLDLVDPWRRARASRDSTSARCRRSRSSNSKSRGVFASASL